MEEREDEYTAFANHFAKAIEYRHILENVAVHKQTTNNYAEYAEGEYFLDCWQLEGPKSKFYDITIFQSGKNIYHETTEKPYSQEELKNFLQDYLSSEEDEEDEEEK